LKCSLLFIQFNIELFFFDQNALLYSLVDMRVGLHRLPFLLLSIDQYSLVLFLELFALSLLLEQVKTQHFHFMSLYFQFVLQLIVNMLKFHLVALQLLVLLG
jgi:hypothetical protein